MQTLAKDTNGILRFGLVEEYDAKRHMGKVYFQAMNGIISAWLPVILPSTSGNKSEHHIDCGTHVACLLQGEGVESGIILGAFYDDTNKPVTGNPDIWSESFSDGTTIQYDRKNHKLNVESAGEVNVSAKGNVTVSGENVTVSSSGNTDITAGGNVSISAGNISITYEAKSGALGIKSPGKLQLDSGGILQVSSAKSLHIAADGAINISSPGHVTISGSSVSIPGLVL